MTLRLIVKKSSRLILGIVSLLIDSGFGISGKLVMGYLALKMTYQQLTTDGYC